MKFCSNCGNKLSDNQDVCLKCGKFIKSESSKEKKSIDSKKKNKLIIILIVLLFLFIGIVAIGSNSNLEDNIDISEYSALNPQELHSDYIANEISAEDKYKNNYYYFTGKVYKVEEFWGDTYLKIQYNDNSSEKSKLIELDAYFNNGDILRSVNKDDEVTVYCKFQSRGIEDFMGTITTYTFKNCKFK